MKVRAVELYGHQATELREGGVRMVVVHDVGPRIAWFGRDANLLFWDHEQQHKRGEWRLYGGHRLWVTRPGADESEETYAPDNGACTVRTGRGAIDFVAPVAASGIEKALRIRADHRMFTIEHRVTNRSDMLWSGGAWALTATLPSRATRYRVPLGGGPAAWDVATIVVPLRWGGTHSSRLDDEQFLFERDAMLVRPRGREAKRMFGAPQGKLEMIDRRRGTFRKHAPLVANASYPLASNLAVYVGPNNFMVELETMSPFQVLAPGQSLRHVETWALH